MKKMVNPVLFADAFFLTGLICIALISGIVSLDGWNGPAGSLSLDLYKASAMLAWGNGFTDVSEDNAPALREFFNFERKRLALEDLPDELKRQDLHAYQNMHRYQLYTVAAVWKITGVSWETFKIVNVGMLIITAAILYGIFRLAMNPGFSFAGVLLFFHQGMVMHQLHCLRDFSKAPFILGVLFILGLLLIRPRKPRSLLAGAVLIGVVIGIGAGFRRDVLVALPAAVIILACFVPVEGRRWWAWRPGAVLLMTGCLILIAWPIFKAFQATGSLVFHDAMMGMATPYDGELGLVSASYERFYAGNDLFISDSSNILFNHIPGLSKSRLLFMRIASYFSADLLTRLYASINQIVGGHFYRLGHPVIKTGSLLIPALIILILTGVRLRLGLALAFLAAYFGGIASLQFHERHYFHLYFLPYWFAGAGLEMILSGGIRLVKRWKQNSGSVFLIPENFIRRIVITLIVSLILGIVPLSLLRLYQSGRVSSLLTRYTTAEKTPVQTTMEQHGAWIQFRPVRHSEITQDAWVDETGIQSTALLAVELELPPERYAWLRYEIEAFGGGYYSTPVNFEPAGIVKHGVITYFFPVHEHNPPFLWSRFTGIALPAEYAEAFKGMYRLKQPDSFPLLLTAAIPDDPGQCRFYQRLSGQDTRIWFKQDHIPPEAALWQAQAESASCAGQDDWPEAIRICEAALDKPESSSYAVSAIVSVC
jgi:hypothetical protein